MAAAVTYTGGDQRSSRRHVLPSTGMRSRSSIRMFIRLCAASGLGVYLGASIAGLLAVITGQPLTAGSPWATIALTSAVAGAGAGAAACWLTRRWLLTKVSARWWTFIVAGVITLPLFTVVGQLRTVGSADALLALGGGVVMVVVYWRVSRTGSRSLDSRAAVRSR